MTTGVRIFEKETLIPASPGHRNLIEHFKSAFEFKDAAAFPVRFAISRLDDFHYQCELGVLEGIDTYAERPKFSLFDFVKRKINRSDDFNTVFIVPTGIGSEVGGHAGDSTPAARVIAEACDRLILHPNVVNASDLNEMPENALYIEGSTIARLLMGTVGLQPVRSNRVLVIIDEHEIEVFSNDTVNAISAARATYGLDCPAVVKLDPPLKMTAQFTKSGRAAGVVGGLERIREVLKDFAGTYDAVAIASVVEASEKYHEAYFHSDGKMTNPWGGVEAMLTHSMSLLEGIPTAHSPMLENYTVANFDLGIVDPRLAAEAVSLTFLQCMLKGLQRSPRIVTDTSAMREHGVFTAADVSCLIMPDKCIGLPTLAALEQGIPVIAVRENSNLMENDLNALPWAPGQLNIVENYWEAVGVMTALKAGIKPASLRRPLTSTTVKVHKSTEVEIEELDVQKQVGLKD